MNRIDISKRSLGVNFHTTKAEVLLWAPFAQKAEILLYEKRIKLPLIQQEFGYWQLETDLIKPGELYKFILNGEKELPDPASLSQPEGVHGPSQTIDLRSYVWNDSDWQNPALQDYLIYELHTGTFSAEGTFSSLEEKLDHLQDLGINAIEIMPVAQFPGNRNWGYDGVFPYAVQSSYGGQQELKHLVNACHKKGLGVILDVVYNHFGPEGNYFHEFGPYFTNKYHTPWGDAINFDDAGCDGVRRFFIENVLMWFRDFHIDALRLDAVHAIKDFSANHILREIKQHVNNLIEETGRNHYLIAELDLNDHRFIDPLEKQGYGMDAQWIDEFHHALRVTAGEERAGYYSDFNGISHLAKAYKDAYVYDGQYSPHRQKTFGSKALKNPGHQFIVFSQNHDQIGNRMLGERSSRLVSFEMQKLIAGAVMVSPYIPMLFMGEEWSEPHPFLYFISHTDEKLVEAVRKGRKEEFAAFHAIGEAPDPQAEETFQQSKLQWHLLKLDKHQLIFHYYQSLISIRKQHAALNRLNRKQLDVQYNEQCQTLLLHRWHERQHIICLMNFSKNNQQMTLSDRNKEWNLLLNSADPQWGGKAQSHPTISGESKIKLQPESILIYQSYV